MNHLMSNDELIECLERNLAVYFYSHKIPVMSEDMRKGLTTSKLRELQDAVREILATIDGNGLAIVPVKATDEMNIAAQGMQKYTDSPSDFYEAMIGFGRL